MDLSQVVNILLFERLFLPNILPARRFLFKRKTGITSAGFMLLQYFYVI